MSAWHGHAVCLGCHDMATACVCTATWPCWAQARCPQSEVEAGYQLPTVREKHNISAGCRHHHHRGALQVWAPRPRSYSDSQTMPSSRCYCSPRATQLSSNSSWHCDSASAERCSRRGPPKRCRGVACSNPTNRSSMTPQQTHQDQTPRKRCRQADRPPRSTAQARA